MFVFLMDIGVMLQIPNDQASTNVSSICKYINDHAEIPYDRQILLAHGGLCLKPSDRLEHGEGEHETNPIFVFAKTFINEDHFRRPNSFYANESGILKKTEELLSISLSQQILDMLLKNMDTLTELSQGVCNKVEEIYVQQRYMVQGWQVAAANLAEVGSAAADIVENATVELRKFETHALNYENYLKSYDRIKSSLVSIPLLPQIVKHFYPQETDATITTLFELLCLQVIPRSSSARANNPSNASTTGSSTIRPTSQFGGSLAAGLANLDKLAATPACIQQQQPLSARSSAVVTMSGGQSVTVQLRNATGHKINRRRTASMRDSPDDNLLNTSPASSPLAQQSSVKMIVGSPSSSEGGFSVPQRSSLIGPSASLGRMMTGSSSMQHLNSPPMDQPQRLSDLGSSPLHEESRETQPCSNAQQQLPQIYSEFCQQVEQSRHSFEYLRVGVGNLEKTASVIALTTHNTAGITSTGPARPISMSIQECDSDVSCIVDDQTTDSRTSSSTEMSYVRFLINQLREKADSIKADPSIMGFSMNESTILEQSIVVDDGLVRRSNLDPMIKTPLPKSMLLDESEYNESSASGGDQQQSAAGALLEDPVNFSKHLDRLSQLVNQCKRGHQELRHRRQVVLDRYGSVYNDQRTIIESGWEFVHGFMRQRDHLELMCNMKIRLSEYLCNRQKWMQVIQNDINRLDKALQFCLQLITRVATTSLLLRQMKYAPEVYVSCLVEIVRRREFEREWHHWHGVVMDDGNMVRQEELAARKRFSKSLAHPLITTFFGPLAKVKLCRWMGTVSVPGSATRQQRSSLGVSTNAKQLKSNATSLQRSSTIVSDSADFVRSSLRLKQPPSSVRFDERNVQTISGEERASLSQLGRFISANTSDQSPQTAQTSLEEKASSAASNKLQAISSCNSVPDLMSLHEKPLRRTDPMLMPRRGSGTFNNSLLSPMPETADGLEEEDELIRQEDFKPIAQAGIKGSLMMVTSKLEECLASLNLPDVTREDLQTLSARVPLNLADILLCRDQAPFDDFALTPMDEEQSFHFDEDFCAGASSLHTMVQNRGLLGRKSRNIFSRYRMMNTSNASLESNKAAPQVDRKRLQSESSIYSQLAGSLNTDAWLKQQQSFCCQTEMSPTLPGCEEITLTTSPQPSEAKPGFSHMASMQVDEKPITMDEHPVTEERGTQTNPEQEQVSRVDRATSPMALEGKPEMVCSLYQPTKSSEEEGEGDDSSSDGYYEVVSNEVPAANNSNLPVTPSMFSSFFSARNSQTEPTEASKELQSLMSTQQLLLNALKSGESVPDQLIDELLASLQKVGISLTRAEPRQEPQQTQPEFVPTTEGATQITRSFLDQLQIDHATEVEPQTTVEIAIQTAVVKPAGSVQSLLANPGALELQPKMYQFVHKNFSQGDIVAFIPIQVYVPGKGSCEESDKMLGSVITTGSELGPGGIMAHSSMASSPPKHGPMIMARSNQNDCNLLSGSQRRALDANQREQWRMVSTDGHVYFLNEEDFPALGLDELAVLRANKGYEAFTSRNRRNRALAPVEASSSLAPPCVIGQGGNYVPISQRNHLVVFARYQAKQMCITKEKSNRYNLPSSFHFYRVRAQPLNASTALL